MITKNLSIGSTFFQEAFVKLLHPTNQEMNELETKEVAREIHHT